MRVEEERVGRCGGGEVGACVDEGKEEELDGDIRVEDLRGEGVGRVQTAVVGEAHKGDTKEVGDVGHDWGESRLRSDRL